MDVGELISTYGYPVVILGAMVEGETIVIAAAYLAHRHHLPVWPIVACAALGATLGDQFFFLLGRKGGERAVARLPRSIEKRVARARAAVALHPVHVLLSMRFVYGMRIALPLLCGASPMTFARFARYNVATAVAWAALFTGIGYAFGAAASVAIHRIEHYEGWLLLALVVAGLAFHKLATWRAAKKLSNVR